MAAILKMFNIQDRFMLTPEMEGAAKINIEKVFFTLITSSAMTPQRERTS